MPRDDVLEVLTTDVWSATIPREGQERALSALEGGRVIFLPQLGFEVHPGEKRFMSADIAEGSRKNISFDPDCGELGGNRLGPDAAELAALLTRFATHAEVFLHTLLPGYAPYLERARTSFRPVEIRGRKQTPRHDDRLLHVDAFPTRPMRGRRILRVFSNIAPDESPREWRVGEDFEQYARRFLPRVPKPWPGASAIQAALRITRGRRAAYDALMLGLHDQGKYDAVWQRESEQATILFPAGSTWICFTDSVLHAAMAGRFALEQTFHIPVAAMARPELSPLRVLEKLTGRVLA